MSNRLSIFNKFLSLPSIFKDKNKTQLEKQVDLFLDSEGYEAFLEMKSHGYIPTKKQIKKIDDTIYEWAGSGHWHHYRRMEALIEKGLPINDRHMAELICSQNSPLKSWHNGKIITGENQVITEHDHANGFAFVNLSREIKKCLNSPEFFKVVYKKLKEQIYTADGYNTYGIMNNYEKILKNCPDKLFKDVSFDEFMELYVKIKKSNAGSNHKELFDTILNTTYNKGIKDILIQTKKTYASDFVENKTIEKITSEIATTKDLPEAASKLVKSIEDFYQKIKLNKDPSVEQEHLIDNLLEKRVPEILAKYLKVDPTYRTTMFNHEGKNAEQLMFESLENVQVIFHEMFEELNKNSLNSLTATNRYTKMLKHK